MEPALLDRSVVARFTTLAALLAVSLSLAACGGGGGSSAGAGASALPVGPAFSGSHNPTGPTGPMQTGGTVQSTFSGGFLLNTGSPHGLIEVFVSSSTSISGPAPFAGETVSVTGNGSWSSSIAATSVAQSTGSLNTPTPAPGGVSTPTPSPISTPSGVSSTSGVIAGPRSGGFTLDQGYPYGKIPVVLPSNALVVGGAAVTGAHILLTGSGSVHSGMNATVVTVGPSTSVTAAGTIVAGTSYGFTLNVDALHNAVPIVVTPVTVIAGGVLESGATAQVIGLGSTSTAITPTQIIVTDPTPTPAPHSTNTPTPGPISQTHVLTADYLGGYYGTHNIAWSTAAQSLTWASTGVTDANAISATGIKTMYYTDPNRVQAGDPMYTSNEATFAHDCNGNRVTDVFGGRVSQYVMDVTNPPLASLYSSVLRQQTAGAHFDAIFEDDAGPLSDYTGFSAMPCNYSDSAWLTGGATVNDAAIAPVIFNGLSGLQGHNVSGSIGLLSDNHTLGGNFEHCYTDDQTPKMNGWLWQTIENTEIQVNATGKVFECQERNSSSAASQVDARIYALASFLLTYNPSTSILWEMYGTTSGFHVEPESQLVVMNPLTAPPSSIGGLLTTSGNYGRQYANCYLAGQYMGPCAIAVNPDSQLSHPFPYPQYTHTLTLSGGGIVDGGTVAVNGGPPPSSLAPMESAIVFP